MLRHFTNQWLPSQFIFLRIYDDQNALVDLSVKCFSHNYICNNSERFFHKMHGHRISWHVAQNRIEHNSTTPNG
jgi:hypothetical protein